MSHISENNHKTNEEFIPPSQWGGEVLVDEAVVRANLIDIENKIAPLKPRIVGVTKYFGLNAIIKGYEAGLRDFAESRALEAIDKIKSLPEEIRYNSKFHFIGHLQTNKAEKVVEHFDYIHSVDSLKLAKAISKSACLFNKREKVLLQVNNAEEEQKFGYTKEQLKLDLSEILNLNGLEVIGLMNMAPFGASKDELRSLFSDLRKFRDELECEFKIKLPELSMGMSNDYEIAVQEGATIIRIGRKLFN
ncbi:MAG: YggS family pyridoxal phosphate-dependent enzyme [Candidatus Gastranaerophilales bacterium]|nr:YggS family pyridoxal phosphate-dependent enzyme [Candidatus Gastranaerophilales bacterium]MCM1072997.1 YggS family pyridoxal phosphate-dependent enzyme [Bacteroides sp.]